MKTNVTAVEQAMRKAEEILLAHPENITLPTFTLEVESVKEEIERQKSWLQKAVQLYLTAEEQLGTIKNIPSWEFHREARKAADGIFQLLRKIRVEAEARMLQDQLETALLTWRFRRLKELVVQNQKLVNEAPETKEPLLEFERLLREGVQKRLFIELPTESSSEDNNAVFWRGKLFSCPEEQEGQNTLLQEVKDTARVLRMVTRDRIREKVRELKEKEGFREDLSGILKGEEGWYRLHQPFYKKEGKIQQEGVILLQVKTEGEKTKVIPLDGAGCFEWVAEPPVPDPFLTLPQVHRGVRGVNQSIPDGRLKDYLTKLAGVLRYFLLLERRNPEKGKKTE